MGLHPLSARVPVRARTEPLVALDLAGRYFDLPKSRLRSGEWQGSARQGYTEIHGGRACWPLSLPSRAIGDDTPETLPRKTGPFRVGTDALSKPVATPRRLVFPSRKIGASLGATSKPKAGHLRGRSDNLLANHVAASASTTAQLDRLGQRTDLLALQHPHDHAEPARALQTVARIEE